MTCRSIVLKKKVLKYVQLKSTLVIIILYYYAYTDLLMEIFDGFAVQLASKEMRAYGHKMDVHSVIISLRVSKHFGVVQF